MARLAPYIFWSENPENRVVCIFNLTFTRKLSNMFCACEKWKVLEYLRLEKGLRKFHFLCKLLAFYMVVSFLGFSTPPQ